METDRTAKTPLTKRLGFRVVAVLASIAIVPFIISMTVLFYVAREDVSGYMGKVLAHEADGLGKQLSLELESIVDEARGMAAAKTVTAAASPDETREFFDQLKAIDKTIISVDVSPLPPSPRESLAISKAAIKASVFVPDGQGGHKALLTLTHKTEPVFMSVADYASGHQGSALLASRDEVLSVATGFTEVPALEVFLRPGAWNTYFAFDQIYYYGKRIIENSLLDPEQSPRVMVIMPQSAIFSDFNYAASRAGLMMVVLAVVVLALAWAMADKFLRPIKAIRQGAEIISRINLSYRLKIETGDELEFLADDFNRMAEALQSTYDELETRVAQTTKNLKEERNRLATLLRTMTEGLVVTNDAGEILLLNPRARAALDTGLSSGIGLPLNKALPADRLEYHLRRVKAAWNEGRDTIEQTVFPLANNTVLRGVISAVPGPEGERAGFLFVFRDITKDVLAEEVSRKILKDIPLGLKGNVTSIRNFGDILIRRQDLDPPKRQSFVAGIKSEADRAAVYLEELERTSPDLRFARWPIQPANPKDLLRDAVFMASNVKVSIRKDPAHVPLVAVETFTWVFVLYEVLKWLGQACGGEVEAYFEVGEESVILTYRAKHPPKSQDAGLDSLVIEPKGEAPVPLKDAAEHNRAEVWMRNTSEGFEVRLAMTKASVLPDYAKPAEIVDKEVEFYDFDLFMQRRRGGELGSGAKLAELDCVVFDTETTGLNPSEGDQIVSISGVRVRGGKVQKLDTFHSLVNPGMEIPPGSTKIHGITDEMVAGAPYISEVLPKFFDWAGDDVLVAHNAAFDMKMLEISTTAHHIRMIENDVLDTLFLSYGMHADLQGHSLEAMANRMGIEIEGRHTSLGDAIATAQIFVRLIPLLEARGIITLGDAKAYCDKMVVLKWQSSRF